MGSDSSNSQETFLVQALTRLLRPLVRFLLSRGFTYARLIQILRPLYVELAMQQSLEKSKPLTDSRISVLTGIARRYVKTLRLSPAPTDPAALKISPNAKLIAQWITNVRYLNARGQPLILDRLRNNIDQPSFEELALLASSDVRPRTLLDDLLEKGLIRLLEEDRVELLAQAYKPDQSTNKLIEYFGIHMHDHLAATTHNLVHNEEPFFERSAFQDQLSPESIKTLKQFTDEQAMDMLKSVYKYAAELAQQDASSNPDSSWRFRIGAYCFAEDEDKNLDQDRSETNDRGKKGVDEN